MITQLNTHVHLRVPTTTVYSVIQHVTCGVLWQRALIGELAMYSGTFLSDRRNLACMVTSSLYLSLKDQAITVRTFDVQW